MSHRARIDFWGGPLDGQVWKLPRGTDPCDRIWPNDGHVHKSPYKHKKIAFVIGAIAILIEFGMILALTIGMIVLIILAILDF